MFPRVYKYLDANESIVAKWPSYLVHRTHALGVVSSRVWARIPVITLKGTRFLGSVKLAFEKHL